MPMRDDKVEHPSRVSATNSIACSKTATPLRSTQPCGDVSERRGSLRLCSNRRSPTDRWPAQLLRVNSVAVSACDGTSHSSLGKGFRGISSLSLRYSTVPCRFTPDSVFRRVPKGNGRYERRGGHRGHENEHDNSSRRLRSAGRSDGRPRMRQLPVGSGGRQ
jgi:hypothetical protein